MLTAASLPCRARYRPIEVHSMTCIPGHSRFALLIQLAIMPLPWLVRRPLLNLAFGFSIDSHARIGWSLVLAQQLVMAPGARIGHANLIRNLELLHLAP